MSDFLVVLAVYYACNATAPDHGVRTSDTLACASAYEMTKVAFLTEAEQADLATIPGPERAALLRKGYLRFVDWEKGHPDLVAALQQGEILALN